MLSLPFPNPILPVERPSGRKGNKKVRTGCITCKIRKVKCDEARPHCLRCVKSHRKCDGYQTPSPRSTQGAMSPSPTPGFESSSSASQTARAFDYYRTRSAGVLSGKLDNDFWGGLVLRLSATEPAVHHAILAVSSLHEYVDVKSATGRELNRTFAFREYGNAIRSLRNWSQRDEPSAVPLIVCILFICIEFLADRDAASQMHILQGRKILAGLTDDHSPSMEIIKHWLVPIYSRLSLASILFGNQPASIPAHLKPSTEVPAIFASIEYARSSLYLILDEGLLFSRRAYQTIYNPATEPDQLQELEADQQRLLSQLSRWNAAFTVFTSTNPQPSSSENVINMLRIYYQASLIWISTANQVDELAFDAHLSDFASIISLASTIISSFPANAKMEAFSFEMELIGPLYWTAAKCRHPLLRRAALQLLMRDQMRNRRESLWHVRETIVTAASVIEKEEAGLFSPSASGGARESSFDSSHSDETNSEFSPKPAAEPSGVPISSPPSLAPLTPSFTDPMPEEDNYVPEFTSGSFDSPPSPTTIAMEAMRNLDLDTVKASCLEAPFGIPESKRIKNTLIGQTENGGVWITIFRDPEPGGTQWNVQKEFLQC
ncbi:hypothetical protein BGZ63DRAFT_388448 [Mariannaea sp. PMI_226]|nr:hypothetical protein BGZ63DRAFT_388448 [Mariannaea sp. PMI_226]